MCWMGFKHYNSPFSLMFAGSVFFLFKWLPDSKLIGRISIWLAPSIFSVFLIHANTYGSDCFIRFERFLITDLGWNYYLACFTVAVSIFGICIFLDMPRRLVVRLIRATRLMGAER